MFVLFGLMSALVCTPLIGEGATTEELLELIAGRLTTLESVHQRAEMTVTFQIEGESEEVVQENVLIYQRPNQLVVDSEMMILVSDGELLRIIFPQFERFIGMPVGADGIGSALTLQEEYIGGAVLPDVMALLSEDPGAVLEDFLEDLTVEWMGEEERAGRRSWVVRILIGDEEMRLEDGLRVWIDQETGLVSGLHAVVDLSAFQDSPFAAAMPSGYALDYQVEYLAINETLPEDLFAFDTDGFVQSEDFESLAQALQSEHAGLQEMDWIGEEAPDFQLTLLDGDRFRLSEQRGNVVLVDFWATWCPPCIESLPYLQRIYESLQGDDLVFIGVSLDRPGAGRQVRNMVERFGLSYLIGIDEEGDIGALYRAMSIPMLVVVDAEGVVRYQKVGFDPDGMKQVEAELIRLLGRD